MAAIKEGLQVNRKPIRLTILVEDMGFGGTQRYTAHLLKYLDRERFSPELWVLRRESEMIPLKEISDIRIKFLSDSRKVGPSSILHLMWRLIKDRPQILYTLTAIPNIWGRIFGKMSRVPAIISGYRSLLPAQREKWLWPISKRIICNAKILKDIMVEQIGVEASRIEVIPNGVDTDRFSPAIRTGDPGLSVLSIGRMVKDKDPVTLIKAFGIAAQELPDVHFSIIGSGRLHKRVRAEIKTLSLESRMTLLSGTNDVVRHLRRVSIFVMSSVREASPNVIIEAMACGLPVVATRVGGIPELVEHGRTGFLVEPHSPDKLAHGLIDLLLDEPLRLSMGRRARKRVMTHHGLEKMIKHTENIFLECSNLNSTT